MPLELKQESMQETHSDFRQGSWASQYKPGAWNAPQFVNLIENTELKTSIHFVKTVLDILVIIHAHPQSGVRVFLSGIPPWLDRSKPVTTVISWSEQGLGFWIDGKPIPLSPMAIQASIAKEGQGIMFGYLEAIPSSSPPTT